MNLKNVCVASAMAWIAMNAAAWADITAVSVIDDSACVEVVLTRVGEATPWRAYTVDGPPRLVVEIDRQQWTSISADFKSLAITKAEMQTTETGVRLTLPLAEPLSIDSVDDAPDVIRVRLMPTTAAAFRAESEQPTWPRAADKLAFDLPLVRLDPRAPEGSAAHAFSVDLRLALLATGGLDVTLAGEEDDTEPSLVLSFGSDRDEIDAITATPVASAGGDTLASLLSDAGIAATQTVSDGKVPTLRFWPGITDLDTEARAAFVEGITSAVLTWSTRTATP